MSPDDPARLVHVKPAMHALVLVLALLVAPTDDPKSEAAAAVALKPAAASQAGASKTIVGEIVWVDFPSRLVLVRESVKSTTIKGKPATRETIALAVAPGVPVIRGKHSSTFAELKPNDHVVARYLPTSDGARALSLRVADAAGVPPRGASGPPPVPSGSAGETD